MVTRSEIRRGPPGTEVGQEAVALIVGEQTLDVDEPVYQAFDAAGVLGPVRRPRLIHHQSRGGELTAEALADRGAGIDRARTGARHRRWPPRRAGGSWLTSR
jgi:hypothetical protein